MRKIIITGVIAGVLATMGVGLASGAPTVRCGTRYTPLCTNPSLAVSPLALTCHNTGATIALPAITVKS